jgi:hypothetical protein
MLSHLSTRHGRACPDHPDYPARPDAAFLPYRQMSHFIRTQFPGWFGVSRIARSDYMGTAFDTTYSFRLPSGKLVDRFAILPEQKLSAASREKMQEGTWRPPSRWELLNNPLEAAYTERLVEMARNHCVETIFIYLPAYGGAPHSYDELSPSRSAPRCTSARQ